MAKTSTKAPVSAIVAVLVIGALLVVGINYLLTRNSRSSETASSQTEIEVVEADDKAGDQMPEQLADTPFTQLLKAGEIHSIRLVGDSITAGYGTDGYVNPDEEANGTIIFDDGAGTVHFETSESARSWANAFRAWAREHAIDDFVNAGINGAFMHALAITPDACWLMGGADVVVIALGTNDAGYYGPGEFEADARAAFAAAKECSKLVVCLAPVADLRPTDTLVESAASLGEIVREIATEQGCLFCDPRAYVTPAMFNADGLHPTSEGSLAIWQALRETLGI